MECYVEMSQYFIDKNCLFISSAGKIESLQEFKLNFPSSCFIVDDSHVISTCNVVPKILNGLSSQ